MPLFEPPSFPRLDHVILTVEGVFNLLNRIDTKKSTEPGSIHDMFLRQYSHPISKYLHVIFTASLSLCFLPSDWRTTKAILVHKSRDRSSFSNYRPISLKHNLQKSRTCYLFSYLTSFPKALYH